jgi:hypothetical protein
VVHAWVQVANISTDRSNIVHMHIMAYDSIHTVFKNHKNTKSKKGMEGKKGDGGNKK